VAVSVRRAAFTAERLRFAVARRLLMRGRAIVALTRRPAMNEQPTPSVVDDDPVVLPTHPLVPRGSLRKLALGCALLPFVLSYTTTVSSGSYVVYRNWTAIGGGGLALLVGLALLPSALRAGEERKRSLVWAGAVIGVALWHLVVRSGLVL
jgi:hypothetical protein